MKENSFLFYFIETIKKLSPFFIIKNPTMFLVYLAAIFCTLYLGFHEQKIDFFDFQICFWLWITILISNFSETYAQGKGKAQTQSLKGLKDDLYAKKKDIQGNWVNVPAHQLRKKDVIWVIKNEIIPADGTVIEGVASVDESAITGESAPVIREAGGDRSAVTGGTTILSDHLIIEVTKDPGESFLDKMIHLVEGSARQKTPNEIVLTIFLSALSLVFILTTYTLYYLGVETSFQFSVFSIVSLFVCLAPTTICGLLSCIGISGMNRLLKQNVLALSGRSAEAAGDVDILILDKTGTITIGNRVAYAFYPLPSISEQEFAEVAALSSFFDHTPEGRSIIALSQKLGIKAQLPENAVAIDFSAETKMSGVDTPFFQIRKGAAKAIYAWSNIKSDPPAFLQEKINIISLQGGTPLLASRNKEILGVIHLKDTIKPGIRDRFARIHAMNIQTIMITGDNELTAKAIANEAGVHKFFAEAKPEDKLAIIREYQKKGHIIAMSGDGTNDAPALAQSDVGLVMNTGTQAAREAGNMVDLDSDPTKIIEIVEIGKQLLITRGALTTFSMANDVSKYFVLIPALFAKIHPNFSQFDFLKLHSSESAILSAIIFNALIILVLIPLALKGVNFKPQSKKTLFKKNICVYGIGGILFPFLGIKLIDLAMEYFIS